MDRVCLPLLLQSTKPWAEQFFSTELLKLSSSTLSFTSIDPLEGDCEVGMRKSKVITIYDLKLTAKFSNNAEEEEKVSGTLTAVEVSHDMDEEEYQFEVSVDQSGSKAEKARLEAKKELADLCRPVFTKFPKVGRKFPSQLSEE